MNVGVIAGAAVARMLERRIAKNFIHYQNEQQQQRGQTMPTKKTKKKKAVKKTVAKKPTAKTKKKKAAKKIVLEKEFKNITLVELNAKEMAVICNALSNSSEPAAKSILRDFKSQIKK